MKTTKETSFNCLFDQTKSLSDRHILTMHNITPPTYMYIVYIHSYSMYISIEYIYTYTVYTIILNIIFITVLCVLI